MPLQAVRQRGAGDSAEKVPRGERGGVVKGGMAGWPWEGNVTRWKLRPAGVGGLDPGIPPG